MRTRGGFQNLTLNRKVTRTNGDQPKASLLGLPKELRIQIYKYVFHGMMFIRLSNKRSPEPPLLRVCRQVRREASYIFYTVGDPRKFYALCRGLRCGQLIKRLRRFSEAGVRRTDILTILLRKPRRRQSKNVFNLVKFVAETGLDFTKRPRYWGRLFVAFPLVEKCNNLRTTMHEALELGLRAYEEDWSEYMLESAFLALLDENFALFPSSE